MLSAQNLGRSYKGKKIVRDFFFNIKKGEIVGLLGPNGAGKTTSFYMIVGLIKPDHGHIFLDGEDISKLPIYLRARRGIGYLPQESSIFKDLTVSENVMAILEIAENDIEKRKRKLEDLLSEFSISHLADVPAVALSGGETRRVEIARCLATNPTYILLDEPFAGIDPISINEIKELILHLKKRGVGVLITDHNVREAVSLMDRVYIMYDGAVLFNGDTADVISNDEVRKLYLGEKFIYES